MAPATPPDWASQTPNVPGLHDSALFQAAAQLPNAEQFLATIELLVQYFIGQIAIAFGAIEILGWHPFAFLQTWGQNLQQQALAAYLGQEQANTNLGTLLDGIMGTGHTFEQLATFLSAMASLADNASANFNLLLSGLNNGTGLPNISALISYLNAAADNALGAAEAWADAVAGAAVDDAEAFGAAVSGALDKLVHVSSAGLYDAAVGFQNQATSLLKFLTPTGGNIGQFDAAGLAGALNGAVTLGGTQISTLLQNLDSAGRFAASQLTGALNGAVTLGGTQLSTLLQNLDATGKFAANQLVGALNTGLTVGGVTLNTLFTNINSAGQIIGSGITGAINTAATLGGTALSTLQTNWNAAVTNAQGLITGINNATAGLVSGGSALLADAQAGLQALLQAPAQYLQGVLGQFGLVATQNAYAAAAAAQAAQASQLTAQQAAFAAVFNVSPVSSGNVSQTIDYTTKADAANMSGVMLPGNTRIGITSGAAEWQGTAAGSATEVFPTPTSTDYQAITATLGPLHHLLSGYAYVKTLVCGRVNSARNTYVAVTLYSVVQNTYDFYQVMELGCYVNGTYTALASVSSLSTLGSGPRPFTWSTGGLVKLVLGDPSSSSPYAMQVLYNGTPIITYTDSAHISQLGASNRYVGLGMVSNAANLAPAGIRSVSYQDNPPASGSFPFSGRPTPSTQGRFYFPDDCGRMDLDDGTKWRNIWAGPLVQLTAPPTTGWTAVNAGTATLTSDRDAMLLTCPSQSTLDIHGFVHTLSPASNYTKTFYIETLAPPANYYFAGILLRNSSSGAMLLWSQAVNSGVVAGVYMALQGWTNAATPSTGYANLAMSYMPAWPQLMRIRDDGSIRYYEYSYNGADWRTFYSAARNTFIIPDQIGLAVVNQNTGQPVLLRVRSEA